STSTHTNCLIQVVKERFDQGFRLNRGRAFYSSLSFCQPVSKNFSFLLNRLRFRSALRFTSAGGEFYSVQTRCQPPLSSLFSSFEPKHRQDQTTTLPARRILLESATAATFYFLLTLCLSRSF
ncbi:hypothetical protein, partial [Pseudomonas sp. L-22-4S-12]|uniref:hypothetical protein n=1 Tax=Pseudomonas sp. L-22-4S-12 TaxID=2610893 RepID=UPI0021145808